MSKSTSKKKMPDRSRPGSTTAALSIGSNQDGSDKSATGEKNFMKLTHKNLVTGTWNVRTLFASGKVDELEHELAGYQWDIVGLAETRWTGMGETRTNGGNKIWFSGHDSKHQHGVAFIVNKKTIGSVLGCAPLSCRLISIRLSAKPNNITIMQVYAPTTDYDDQDIEEFYEQLEKAIKSTPKKDILIIQGDFNAKIGPDAYDQWAGTTGRFTIGETNDRGLRLLEFASTHRLTIANSLFPHKPSRITTWHSPNGKTHNQIDFILTPKRFKSSINRAKTRTFPGADIGSDHDLVLMAFKIKLKARLQKDTPRIKFDLEKLRDPEIAKEFQATVGGKFAALNLIDKDINELTNALNESLTESAEQILGKRRPKHNPWMTNEILNLCDQRRALKCKKHTNEEGALAYKEANNKVRKSIREAKENWLDEQCAHIEKGMAKGNSKQAFDTLKKITRTQVNKTSAIEDANGTLLTENEEVLKRWTEYCEELYNFPIHPDTNILNQPTITVKEPSPLPVLKEEVEEAIRRLPDGKSPGADNIPAELIKHGGEPVLRLLTTICQKLWQTKEWPNEWTQSLIIPLPKKGNLRKCQNYRTISLISHASKVMLKILLNRLKRESEEHLSEEQAGFRSGRSTVEQIFNCRVLMEKHLQHQRKLFHNFIDFKKAFDRVWHDGLWHTLRSMGIEEGLIQAIQALYSSSSSAVILNSSIGEFFKTTVGVRQGCLLSPVLFNLFLETILKDTLHNFQSTISIGGRSLSNLRFADDIDLIAGSNEELQELTTRLTNSAQAHGMEVSHEKSKTLVNSTDNTTAEIKMGDETLENVSSFKYLGATLTTDGRSTQEIKIRLGLATSAVTKLHRIWKSKDINFPTKMKLYNSLVLSIFLYGCESWTMTAETTKRVQSFETKCMRKLLGISWKDRKTNEYVLSQVELLAGPQEPLLSVIKRRKLSWFGHVTRHTSLPKTILQGTLEGGRKRGRQPKSWMDNIKDWTRMDSPTLIRQAEDRTGWRKLTRDATLMSPLRPFRSGE